MTRESAEQRTETYETVRRGSSTGTNKAARRNLSSLPLLVAIILVAIGGIFLLDRADKQQRDTTRKHHLQDIEQSLYFAKGLHGTIPPYDQPNWCGFLNDPSNSHVREQVEEVLRAQNDKYANIDKPFPTDPLPDQDYFYWKRSPATFELFAVLELDNNNERNTLKCANAGEQYFDYGINSRWREDLGLLTS